MKKGHIYRGYVEKVNFPNKAVVKIIEDVDEKENSLQEEYAVVKHALPGQMILFRMKKVRKGKGEGTLLEVLEPSSLENVKPQCVHFGKCGGCSYQTMSYENQLQIKAGQVKQLLDDVCPEYHFEEILKSPSEWGYRNKMEFSFGDEEKDGPLTLGLHKKGSFYDIINAAGCQIVHKDYSLILEAVHTFFLKIGLSHYKKMSHEGYLRHLLIRRAAKTGEILVALVTSTQASPDLSPLVDALLQLPVEGKIVGILHILNDSLADVVQSDKTLLLYGQDYFYEEILGLRFKISPFSFFQTNSLGAEVLYEKAREYVMDASGTDKLEGKVVFDLYSGTGTIAQLLAPVAKQVIGVEIVEEAVEAARENARLNGLENCSFIAGDVLKVIDEIEEKPDLVILDPPREGIHPKALQKIINFGVEHLIYISCKPTSLARDLVVLQEQGYRLEKACPVDMFPQNPNVETICVLSKKK